MHWEKVGYKIFNYEPKLLKIKTFAWTTYLKKKHKYE